MNEQRLETARLLQRFGFGPRPGEYAKALKDGVAATRAKVLTVPAVDAGAAQVVEPEITDLGKRPAANSAEIVPFSIALRNQTQQMTLWWLDGQDSTAKSPNENLGRELMELFVLGVDRYSEDDVKAAARALTGYQVEKSSGVVTFNLKRHDTKPITILGTTQPFTGEALSDFLVARDDNATFIAERLWYRFISSTEPMPATFAAKKAFAGRDIAAAVAAMASDPAMRDTKNDLVKSPVEWFIAACRALELTPSQLKTPGQLLNYLDKLGQVPFNPPNVGGWPAGAAWLSSATAQYRIAFAAWLIKQSDLRALKEIPVGLRVVNSADWLGVAEWSPRTQTTLRASLADPAQFALLALCSPEFIVSA